jgi:hypothetical protein
MLLPELSCWPPGRPLLYCSEVVRSAAPPTHCGDILRGSPVPADAGARSGCKRKYSHSVTAFRMNTRHWRTIVMRAAGHSRL